MFSGIDESDTLKVSKLDAQFIHSLFLMQTIIKACHEDCHVSVYEPYTAVRGKMSVFI